MRGFVRIASASAGLATPSDIRRSSSAVREGQRETSVFSASSSVGSLRVR